jgi:DNA-binding CsgD family transcriptional regulator
VKTPSSLRYLLRDLELASNAPPSWVLFHPEYQFHKSVWNSELGKVVNSTNPAEVMRIALRVPRGGHLTSTKASWMPHLIHAVFGPNAKTDDQVIFPHHQDSKFVACVGWIAEDEGTESIAANGAAIRRAFRSAWEREKIRSECHAMRWVLSSCDRLTAVVNLYGKILALTPATADLLKSFQMGPSHHFHTCEPKLPTSVMQSLMKAPVGQVKVSKHCTARFTPIESAQASLQPLIGIEFFVERTKGLRHLPLPISLLTPVEHQIYQLIQTGATNKEIAQKRRTAFATAKNQVAGILGKLGVTRRHLMVCGTSPAASFDQLHNPGMNGVTNSRR